MAWSVSAASVLDGAHGGVGGRSLLERGLDRLVGGSGLLTHEVHGLVGGGGLLTRGGGLLAGAQRLILGFGDVGAADLELGAEARDADPQLIRVGTAGGGGLLGGLGDGVGVVEALAHTADLGEHG